MVRRFIAGAVCPGCGAQDTVAVELIDGVPQTRFCVRCDFQDAAPAISTGIPRGRLEKPNAAKQADEIPVQVVQIRDDR